MVAGCFEQLGRPALDPSEGRALLARKMLSAAPAMAPGAAFAHSNANSVVLGRVLERISGRSWKELMRSMLLASLAMDSCGFGALGVSASATPTVQWAHRSTAEGMEPVVLEYATVWWTPTKQTTVLATTNVGILSAQAAAQAAIVVLLKRAGLP